ncbi:hypothetical protein SALBM217S_06160 [Streptomyces griseoloalbus]
MESLPEPGGAEACRYLRERGVETVEIFHDTSDVFHRSSGATPTPGPDPERRTYRSYAVFNDPDGNEWVLQEVPAES